MRSLTFVLVGAIVASAVAFAHGGWPQTSSVTVDKAYIPVGFDDNDMSQVVVKGTLKNPCLWPGPAEVHVDTQGKTITIRQNAYNYPMDCKDRPLPFSKTIDVGILPEGEYTVKDGHRNNAELGKLKVAKAANTGLGPWVDDHTYAIVTDAFLTKEDGRGGASLFLDYQLPDECTKLKETRVQHQGEIVIVTPITERRSGDCPTRFQSRRERVQIRENLTDGTHLLHVRSMFGRSLNKLVDL